MPHGNPDIFQCPPAIAAQSRSPVANLPALVAAVPSCACAPSRRVPCAPCRAWLPFRWTCPHPCSCPACWHGLAPSVAPASQPFLRPTKPPVSDDSESPQAKLPLETKPQSRSRHWLPTASLYDAQTSLLLTGLPRPVYI